MIHWLESRAINLGLESVMGSNPLASVGSSLTPFVSGGSSSDFDIKISCYFHNATKVVII